MEGAFGSYLVQPLAQRLLTEMLQICLFNSNLNISKDGYITDSLCNLSQCLTEWENFLFMSGRNLLTCSGGLLPLILCCVTLGRFCLYLLHPVVGSLKGLIYLPFSCLVL